MSEPEPRPPARGWRAPRAPDDQPDLAWSTPPFAKAELVIGTLGLAYTLSPWRDFPGDLTVFSVIAVAILVFRDRLPPRPARAAGARVELLLAGVTLLTALLLVGYGTWRGVESLRPGIVVRTLLIYLPFAYLQEWITQRYLLQRWAARLTGGHARHALPLGAVVFCLCHLPFPDLLLPTLLSGMGWAYAWGAGARLLPIAISHAVLGGLLFLVWLGRDPFRTLWGA